MPVHVDPRIAADPLTRHALGLAEVGGVDDDTADLPCGDGPLERDGELGHGAAPLKTAGRLCLRRGGAVFEICTPVSGGHGRAGNRQVAARMER